MAMTGTQASSIELQEVGSFPAEKPAFLSLNQGKEGTDLYITTFKALGSDGVRRVENVGSLLNTQIADIRADLLSRKITWPNGMKPVPAEIFGDNYFAVPGGFLVPGKGDGAISIFNPESNDLFRITKKKKGWWYHQVVWTDMNNDGRLDVLTARAKKGMFGGDGGEMVWLEQPADGLKSVWKEHAMIESGPDVNFLYEDFDKDGVKEILATEFFNRRLVLYTKSGETWEQRVIDNKLGYGFDLSYVDLNKDGKLDILATNHEDDENAAVLAYEIPKNITQGSWTKHFLLKGIETLKKGYKEASPGTAVAFYPEVKNTQGKPWIVVSGDGSMRAHLLVPGESDFEYEEKILVNTGGTVGEIAVADVDDDGYSEIFIPAYDKNKIYIHRVIP